MKQTLKWTGLVLLAAGVGLALAVLLTAGVKAQSPITFNRSTAIQATPSPDNGLWGYGPWMMGPYGHAPLGGMMNAMGGFGAWRGTYPVSGAPLTIDQAIEAANRYLSSYGNPDLALTEVMEFSDNFYAEVEEESTGIHAFELLIDRYSGAVYPEPGPNMMWNTKYEHMGGMMGGWWGQAPETISVTPEQARDLAQKWLDQYLPGTSVDEQADAFYGYYTIHVLKDGKVFGMLSVNGYSGDVWYHTWHGDFVKMKELEE